MQYANASWGVNLYGINNTKISRCYSHHAQLLVQATIDSRCYSRHVVLLLQSPRTAPSSISALFFGDWPCLLCAQVLVLADMDSPPLKAYNNIITKIWWHSVGGGTPNYAAALIER